MSLLKIKPRAFGRKGKCGCGRRERSFPQRVVLRQKKVRSHFFLSRLKHGMGFGNYPWQPLGGCEFFTDLLPAVGLVSKFGILDENSPLGLRQARKHATKKSAVALFFVAA